MTRTMTSYILSQNLNSRLQVCSLLTMRWPLAGSSWYLIQHYIYIYIYDLSSLVLRVAFKDSLQDNWLRWLHHLAQKCTRIDRLNGIFSLSLASLNAQTSAQSKTDSAKFLLSWLNNETESGREIEEKYFLGEEDIFDCLEPEYWT